MSQEKFDLKNVGGQPKKWTDGSGQMQDDSGWLGDLWMSLGIVGPVLLILFGLGAFALALLNFVS